MIPLSEERHLKRGDPSLREGREEKVVIKAGDVFESTLGFDLKAGERREVFFDFELHDRARCEISIFVRGEGEFFLERTVNVLGNDAVVSFKVFGETRKIANVCLADDVLVTGERAEISLRTKFVLADEARSAVRQRIVLSPSAHAAKVAQRIDHLLLGELAQAESIPELDVQLDDVTCSHGATTSRPGEEAMFYLFSRGLTKVEAEKTLAHGFLSV